MNKQRLLETAEWLEKNVDSRMFDIRYFRKKQDDQKNHICGSPGCLIGWATGMVQPETLPRYESGIIQFQKWSYDYFDLYSWEWEWCFSENWADTDGSLRGGISRMRWLAENGCPENYEEQMKGIDALCYE